MTASDLTSSPEVTSSFFVDALPSEFIEISLSSSRRCRLSLMFFAFKGFCNRSLIHLVSAINSGNLLSSKMTACHHSEKNLSKAVRSFFPNVLDFNWTS